MMAEGHQQLENIKRMPVAELLEWGAGLQAYVIAKNALVAPAGMTPPSPKP